MAVPRIEEKIKAEAEIDEYEEGWKLDSSQDDTETGTAQTLHAVDSTPIRSIQYLFCPSLPILGHAIKGKLDRDWYMAACSGTAQCFGRVSWRKVIRPQDRKG